MRKGYFNISKHDYRPTFLILNLFAMRQLRRALARCHGSPFDPPTRSFTTVITNEVNLDNVACAGHVGREGEAKTLTFNLNVAISVGPAALPQQCGSITVCDFQVVAPTVMTIFNVKCTELQCHDSPFSHLDYISPCKITWIVVREVW